MARLYRRDNVFNGITIQQKTIFAVKFYSRKTYSHKI